MRKDEKTICEHEADKEVKPSMRSVETRETVKSIPIKIVDDSCHRAEANRCAV